MDVYSFDNSDDMQSNKGDRPVGLDSIWVAFASGTTAHGIGKLVSGNKIIRVLWTLLILIAFGGFSYHLSTLITKFYERPVSTSLDPKGTDFVYPDVTICNRKAFAVSRFAYLNISKTGPPSNGSAFGIPKWKLNTGMDKVYNNLQLLARTITNFADRYFNNSNYSDPDFLQVEDYIKNEMPSLAFVDTYGFEEVLDYSLNPEQTIMSCSYGRHVCTYKHFTRFFSTKRTSCITFNQKQYISSIGANSEDFEDSELNMVFFLDSYYDGMDALMQFYNDTSGALFNMADNGGLDVYIHHKGTYPFEGSKVSLQAASASTIDVFYQNMTKVPGANNICVNSLSEASIQYEMLTENTVSGVNRFSTTHNEFVYTREDCVSNLKQQAIQDNCGCHYHTVPYSKTLKDTKWTSTCMNLTHSVLTNNPNGSIADLFKAILNGVKLSNAEMASIVQLLNNSICARNVYNRKLTDSQLNACPEPCQQGLYKTDVKSYAWPSNVQDMIAKLMDRLLHSNSYYRNGQAVLNDTYIKEVLFGLHDIMMKVKLKNSKAATYMANNFVSIRIRVGDTNSKSFLSVESYSYGLPDIFADLGGILGLYLGISVLTLCELIELLCLITLFVAQCVQKSKMKTFLQNNNNSIHKSLASVKAVDSEETHRTAVDEC